MDVGVRSAARVAAPARHAARCSRTRVVGLLQIPRAASWPRPCHSRLHGLPGERRRTSRSRVRTRARGASTQPFAHPPGDAAIPAGRYDWNEHLVAAWQSDPSRTLSRSRPAATRGGFWSGTQRTRQRERASAADLPVPRSTLGLQSDRRRRSTCRDRAFVTTLVHPAHGLFVQHQHVPGRAGAVRRGPAALHANVRFNFIHRPLSDFFVVYNEQQLRQPGEPVPAGRAVIVKFTRSVAF